MRITTSLQRSFYTRHPARRGSYTDRNGHRHQYHSLMERQRMATLDLAGLHFRREPVRIRYWFRRRWRWYVCDLAVYDETGTRLLRLEECKPSALCEDEQNRAKWKAAQEHCAARGIGFLVVTERNLRAVAA